MEENKREPQETEEKQEPEKKPGEVVNPFDAEKNPDAKIEYGLKEEPETGLRETEHELYRTVNQPDSGERPAYSGERNENRGGFSSEAERTGGRFESRKNPEDEEPQEVYTYVNEAANGSEIRVNKPSRLIRMSKGALVALLLVICLAGAGLGFLGTQYFFMNGGAITGTDGETVTISRELMDEYEAYVEKYSKAETLLQYVSSVYYQDVDEDALMDSMLHGLVEGLGDEYSEYLSSSELEEMNQSYEGEFYGIGVQITNKDGLITVVAPIDGTPAFKAGIRAGDVITHVDGISYSGEELNDAVNHMRGLEGAEVTVTVVRDGVSKEYTFIREKITTETVTAKMLENNIGYIRISEFESNTGELFSEKLDEMEKSGVSGVVVDLRSNPGGLVSEAVKVADEFLDSCTVTTVRDRYGNEEVYSAKRGKTDLPVCFLCDEGSASASEILLAAMKDYGVGEIIGNTTFGKGIVQEFGQLFDDGSGLKLTRYEYFSPNGNTVHKVGVTPTIELDYREDLSDEDYDEFGYLKYSSDLQLQKAVEILSE